MALGVFMLVLWLAWFLVFTGIGGMVFHLFFVVVGRDKTRTWYEQGAGADRVFDRFWLGWAATLFLLQIWHFVLPVNIWSLVVCIFAGLAGWIWRWRSLKSLRFGSWLYTILFSLLLLIAACWLSLQARTTLTPFDHGLYYLQQMIWAKSFPLVVGLANLQERLGFFDGFFLYATMMDVSPWVPGFRLSVSLLMLVLLAQSIRGIVAFVELGAAVGVRQIYYALLLPPVLVKISLGFTVNSAATDSAINILSMVSFGYFLDLLSRHSRDEEPWQNMFVITLISAAGIVIKGSFLAILLGVVTVSFLIWMRGKKRSLFGQQVVRNSIVVAIVAAVIPFLIRNILVTGYVFYPFPHLSLPVDWRVPYNEVNLTYQWVLSFSRVVFGSPQEVLKDASWIGPWFIKMMHEWTAVVIPGSLFILAGIVLWTRAVMLKAFTPVLKMWVIFSVTVVVSLLVWFLSSPSLRFMGMLLPVLASGGVAMLLVTFDLVKPVRVVSVLVLGLLIVVMAINGKWVKPATDPRYFYAFPKVETTPFKTDSGLVTYTPVKDGQCWNSSILCSAQNKPGLMLRCSDGNVRCGFKDAALLKEVK
ncbi:MAG: hypothetical protein HQL22_02770 [Candidatus Omnitrophica bacterium]|nr:hypothetical protein [Candidatus Omnitrophota bacterium]